MPHAVLTLEIELPAWRSTKGLSCMQVAAQQHAITHALPHAYYAANPQAFPEGTLEHLLRAEADPESAHHAMVSPHALFGEEMNHHDPLLHCKFQRLLASCTSSAVAWQASVMLLRPLLLLLQSYSLWRLRMITDNLKSNPM